jgi:hypothetical protein
MAVIVRAEQPQQPALQAAFVLVIVMMVVIVIVIVVYVRMVVAHRPFPRYAVLKVFSGTVITSCFSRPLHYNRYTSSHRTAP